MNFFDRIIGIIREPVRYFAAVKKEGFREPFTFYLLVLLVTNILGTLYVLHDYELALQWYPLVYIGYGLLMLVFFFIGVGIVHGMIKLLGGKGHFADTAKAYVYGAIPAFLWNIPEYAFLILFFENDVVTWIILLLSVAVGIYSLYLNVVGVSLLHKISKGKALAAYVLPLLIFLVGVVVLIIFMLALLAMTGT